jgi:hypothetical protein
MADIRITPAASVMAFTSSLNFKETLTQEASGSLTLLGSGSTGRTDLFTINGNNGTLFSVSDDLSNSLFSVNTIAGLPVIEAFADNTVVMGQYGQNVLVITGSRVGIGTATPTSKLHLRGTTTLLTITDTTYNRTSDIGYLDNANLYFANDSGGNTYIGRYNNVFLAYGGGSVGIGTTNPQGKLAVDGGNIYHNYGNAATGYYFYLNHNSGQDGGMLWTRDNSTFDWQINNLGANGDLAFYSYGAGSQVVTFKRSNGYVGIGPTNPSYKLHVNTSDASADVIGVTNGTQTLTLGVNNSAGGSFLFENGSNALRFGTSGTERMRIDSSGKVGIGTTSPSYKLHTVNEAFIGNSGGTTGLLLSGDNNSRIDFRSGSASTGQITCGNSSNLFIDAFDSRAIELAIAGTTIFEVSPNGNVGVGTAGNVEPSALLEVKSNTQGFLLPRMDDGEMNAIAGPAIGLMVYNTSDDYVYVFGGASWAKLAYV